jgi:hypothetical protein
MELEDRIKKLNYGIDQMMSKGHKKGKKKIGKKGRGHEEEMGEEEMGLKGKLKKKKGKNPFAKV